MAAMDRIGVRHPPRQHPRRVPHTGQRRSCLTGGSQQVMGRKSVKENKNAYQLARESAGLTREAAAERMEFVSEDRVEKIEADRSPAHPDEVLAMAKAYCMPDLVNRFMPGKKIDPQVKAAADDMAGKEEKFEN